jgi:hypothetical protein
MRRRIAFAFTAWAVASVAILTLFSVSPVSATSYATGASPTNVAPQDSGTFHCSVVYGHLQDCNASIMVDARETLWVKINVTHPVAMSVDVCVLGVNTPWVCAENITQYAKTPKKIGRNNDNHTKRIALFAKATFPDNRGDVTAHVSTTK